MATLRIGGKAIVLLCLIMFGYIVEAGHPTRGGHRHRRPIGVGGHHRPGSGRGGPQGPVIDVLQFGAKSGGKKESNMEFIRAWNKACQTPGATLLIPGGEFLVGPVVFQGPCKGPITVEVAGNIKAQTDISFYEEDFWFSFENVDGLMLTGKGTFDGQGAQSWEYNDCKKNSNCQMLPANLKFSKVKNAIVEGIHSLNSMGYHLNILLSNHFLVQNIRITAPAESPNTDGIHISQSSAVNITRSIIGTGDDCVGMVQGTMDVSITDVTCGPGHGFSVGSLGKRKDEKDVTGVLVKNCTLLRTDNGVRIKTWGGSLPSKATTFRFEDIKMDSVRNPILIDQNYCGGKKNCKNGPSRVQVSDVHFTNIRGTTISEFAVTLNCSSTFPCQNVRLFDVDLGYTGMKPIAGGVKSHCMNAKVVYGGKQRPLPC